MGEKIMWNKLGRYLPYALLYIASVAIVGFFNFLTVETRTDILTSPEFWNKTISQNLANLLVLMASIEMYLMMFREKDDEYNQLDKAVRRSVREDLDSEFGEWIYDRNKVEKLRTYQAQIQTIITKQEKKAKVQDLEVWYYGTVEEKRKNRYCRKRKQLEDSMSNERLEKLILAIDVDYDKIDRNFVETGEYQTARKQYAKLDSAGRKVKDNAPQIMFSLGSAAFFNAFIYDADFTNIAFWFQVAYSIFLMSGMFLSGKNYAFNYVKKVLIVDLNTRYNVVKDYLTFKVKTVKEVKADGNK